MLKIAIFLGLFSSLTCAAVTPVDPDATAETKSLYQSLEYLSKDSIIFGHQNALIEGHLINNPPVSDIFKVTGDRPGVFGFDFKAVVHGNSHNFKLYLKKVKNARRGGGIITFSWHTYNPLTGKNFYDKTPAIHSILPGGEKNKLFRSWLDKIAKFAHASVDDNGKLIPIIFRPWHEHNHRWFWWGNSIHKCPEGKSKTSSLCRRKRRLEIREYVKLWRYTYRYLTIKKKVHNFLWAYSPGLFFGSWKSERGYGYKFPGDLYVDIYGLDKYVSSTDILLPQLRFIAREANKRGKISALTETGLEGVPHWEYFTDSLIAPIKNDPIARQLSYVMLWRNAHQNDSHFFVPFKGHPSSKNFIGMKNDPFVIFESELPSKVLYNRRY